MKWPTAHKHDLQVVLSSRWGMVEQCRSCHLFFTTMLDYSDNKVVKLPGNLIGASLSQRVYILCGNEEQFKEAMGIMKAGGWQTISYFHYLHSADQLKGEPFPIIYCYGNYRDNDVCDSPVVTKALNGWL